MSQLRITSSLLAILFFATSCANYTIRNPRTAQKGVSLVAKKSKSGKYTFAHFVHFRDSVYPLKNVQISHRNEASFISGKLDSVNIQYKNTFDEMRPLGKRIPKVHHNYIHQVHYTLKDLDVDSSLFTNGSELIEHEYVYSKVYYKSTPKWIIPVASLGAIGGGLLILIASSLNELNFNIGHW